jgi:hypothetical protein
MPEDVATHRIAEVVGFEPTPDGCVLIRFRDDQGNETHVKVPKELLGRLTDVTASAYHTLVQPAEAPTSPDDISGGRPFGSLENVGIT